MAVKISMKQILLAGVAAAMAAPASAAPIVDLYNTGLGTAGTAAQLDADGRHRLPRQPDQQQLAGEQRHFALADAGGQWQSVVRSDQQWQLCL